MRGNPLLFSLLFIMNGWLACNNHQATDDKDSKAASTIISDSTLQLLTIDSAVVRNIDDEVQLSGEVSFDENKVVKIFPFSSGQVISTSVGIGDYVKAGQELAVIKSADVAGYYSDLASAGNDLAVAKRSMENAESLFRNGIASEKEYIEAKEVYDKMLTNQSRIRQLIAINGGGRTASNGTCIITAPRSGYVVEKLINPGSFIRNDNNSNMFTIGDISDVWIWANVYETDVAKVKPGYRARVTTLAYPDSVFIGTVDKVNPVLDPVAKVMKIRIILPNHAGYLKPEMFTNVTVENQESKKGIAIPSSGIISENGMNYAVVFRNKNDVSIREIRVEKKSGEFTFISGLEAGEKILTRNQILVYRQLRESGQ
ncbi:MAG: efflux RND transporter periplasmic adaptor subunit [Terrimonas sp.]|nr:efflux RND transporter periplasmic adaptor subunit [Terrimonas sp.]